MPVEVAKVVLWGKVIGAVAWDPTRKLASFEYVKAFQESGIELAPLTMPLGPTVYSFPELNPETFQGLPGMLADSLPDKFGNILIDEWLVRTGRDRASFSPIERLCYVGNRGMGALEYWPTIRTGPNRSVPVDISSLVELATKALLEKDSLSTRIGKSADEDLETMRDILRVGTSAGGARAKAVIAWNESTGEVRSGQIQAPDGFGYWLLKFDGVSGNRDKELEDPKGYGAIEYAYYLMAREAGIDMHACRLFEENDRRHFMTRRFDRDQDGRKIFMQTLCGLAHLDFNRAGGTGYEQALDICQRLDLPRSDLHQLFRRMVFNVIARNQDDHTKNIAFLMDKEGRWSLSPAYDITFSFNPNGTWTHHHQMTINGKLDDFEIADFHAVSKRFRIASTTKVTEIIEAVSDVLEQWPKFAGEAGVSKTWIHQIQKTHRNLK